MEQTILERPRLDFPPDFGKEEADRSVLSKRQSTDKNLHVDAPSEGDSWGKF